MGKKALSFILLLVVLVCASPSLADPIAFTSSTYFSSASLGGLPATSTSPSTPTGITYVGTYATAICSAPDNTRFEASAEATPGGSGSAVGKAEAAMAVSFTFTADFPKINIKYDYEVAVIAEGGNFGVAEAAAGILSYLRDLTALNVVFINDVFRSVKVSVNEYDIGTAAGSVDVLLPLVIGNNYELVLDDSGTKAYAYAEATGGAGAVDRVTNIQISAIPLPGSWLLLFSGLAGLVGLRRLRR